MPDKNPVPGCGEFLNRELSWLDFNRRVLAEACCRNNPLLERLKFIAITDRNLDEFFMVRVPGVKNLQNECVQEGMTQQQLLLKLRQETVDFIECREKCLYGELLPELAKQNIKIFTDDRLPEKVKDPLLRIFHEQIEPHLTLHTGILPFFANGDTGLAAMRRDDDGSRKPVFIRIPEETGQFFRMENVFFPVEKIIPEFLPENLSEIMFFRVTRDMAFEIPDSGKEELAGYIDALPAECRRRDAIRLETAGKLHVSTLAELRNILKIDEIYCFHTTGMIALCRLFKLLEKTDRPDLRYAVRIPSEPEELPRGKKVLDALKDAGSVLLALPYQSFSPVIRMLEEAADDSDVTDIKQTLYRTAAGSPVIRALMRAAENGKQVTVCVELKARFDESSNLSLARKLESAGVHVVYGIPGMKVHAKALLVTRMEQGREKHYVHLATGNYNDRTAVSYTDAGLFSCDELLCRDTAELFKVLCSSGKYSQPECRKISISPFALRSRLENLIEREIQAVRSGGSGSIRAKMNSLSDKEMIRLLRRAAAEGVDVKLSVRGICCMLPRKNEKNLRIVSIVDRYLEHSRIFEFGSGGKMEYCLSSADWMPRNLDRRVELLFPVEEEKCRRTLRKILDLQFADNCKARELTAENNSPAPAVTGGIRSQEEIWKYLNRKDDLHE